MTHDLETASADRRRGLVAVLAGVALALAIQVAAPLGVPLYDGVIVQEPYRYLHPIGDQIGDPTSFQSSPAVAGEVSPDFVAATTENPPQVQLVVKDDAFQLTPGATALQVSITAVEPPSVAPPDGAIAGNVYRVTVTDQAGAPLAPKPCDRCITLVLRSPPDVPTPRLERFAGGEWMDVEAIHVPTGGQYLWYATGLGDFAVVGGAGGGGDGLGIERILVFGGAAVVLLLVFVAAMVFRGRRGGEPALVRRASRGVASPGPRSRGVAPPGPRSRGVAPPGPPSRGVPSKRKTRRPPQENQDE
jgi:hypothetical protein